MMLGVGENFLMQGALNLLGLGQFGVFVACNVLLFKSKNCFEITRIVGWVYAFDFGFSIWLWLSHRTGFFVSFDLGSIPSFAPLLVVASSRSGVAALDGAHP